ncbi:hypothetical protein BH11PSE2_BH11PSE2_21880 [soil metagenome]
MQTVLTNTALADTLVPAFTWGELEARLTKLASTPAKKSMVPPLVSAIHKQSWALPWEHVLDRILALAWVLNDDSFQPELETQEEGPLETL